MLSPYNPRDWYWIVAGNEDQLWSSRRRAYVPADDADYLAFFAAGRRPTRIDSEDELGRVLNDQYPEGSPRSHPANGAARRARQFAKALARDPLAALVQQAKETNR